VEGEERGTLVRRTHPLIWASSFDGCLIKLYRQNIVIEWLAVLLYIQEVVGSILDLGASCPDRDFWFASDPLCKCWGSTLK
jgi:hypothetical protein